jgi:hypothetical protein
MRDISEVLSSTTFDDKPAKAKTKEPAVEIHAYVADKADSKELREREKIMMQRRKDIKAILDGWDPSVISDKAKRSFLDQLSETDKELKRIRSQRGL